MGHCAGGSGAAERAGCASPSLTGRLGGPVCRGLGAGEGAEVHGTAQSPKTGAPAAAAAREGRAGSGHTLRHCSPAKRRQAARQHRQKSERSFQRAF